MSDFFQNGTVTTFHNLTDRKVEDLESDLLKFSEQNRLGLILPSLFSELEAPALKNIVAELSKVPYLSQTVIGLDRADAKQFDYAKGFFADLGQEHRILWNDGPRLQKLWNKLKDKGLAPTEPGKGTNVWGCYGYVLAADKVDVVALHDCDIITYQRDLLARLIYPVAHPTFNFVFSKGYYARHAEGKLNGRVARLMVTPLLRALHDVVGPDELISYLDSFRYPLAGEFAMNVHALKDMRIPADWGLEVGILAEMRRNYSKRRICQVDIADVYDHKHQDLSIEDQTKGLARMSQDIAKSLFRKLATRGHVFSRGTMRSVRAVYLRTALDQLESYAFDAEMNGLKLDIHAEEQAVELFARSILAAGDVFLDNAEERPFLPNWNRVASACPTVLEELYEAVELDNRP
ncbi:glycosyl transferase [Thiomicrorhabdus sp. 6S2-11]|uniref:Glycosyl transferase n=1 Tax=Thiomicrorhabdus marina TaxID=2818442 RepID=A0ABS3Q299_9GAMM|nr:glycosyl transferase [Thiomicrorhabdus marina]MBO1926437.1 glycosyl transferase [Thiomicrorhabdus marina]